MKRRFIFPGFLFFSMLLSIWGFEASAQLSTTAYHMYGIPQANHLNPAFQPSCSWHLGMPVLSPLSFKVESTALKYKDIFTFDDGLGEFITFMHPNADKDVFMNALKPHNNIRLSTSFDLLSFGFRKDQMYFSLDITDRIENTFVIPEDFFEFAVYLSKNQDRFSFVANAQARVTDLNLTTSTDVWDVNSRIDADISFPGIVTASQPDGLMDSIEFNIDDVETSDLIKTVIGLGNPGFAVDFGFQYRPLDYLTVSGSINDLGFIRWKNNVTNLSNDGAFTFEGIEIDILSSEADDETSPVDEIIDSLTSQMDFYVSNNPYTTMLSGGFHLGAAYELNEKVRFGVVNRTKVYKAKFYNQFTLSANVQPIRAFSASLSYSVIGKNFANIGIGLSMYAGPFNLYFITDQLPSATLIPSSMQSVSFRLGMNLVFGCSKKKKAMGDRPLID